MSSIWRKTSNEGRGVGRLLLNNTELFTGYANQCLYCDDVIVSEYSPYYLLCFRNELSMTPDGIKVEKSGDKYSFTFQMNCKKGEEQFEKKISGTLELDEYKKISYFKILDDEGLIKMVR